MSSQRSTRLTSLRRFRVRRWFWVVSLALALTPACSRQDQAADSQSLMEAEVYASEDEVSGMELRERLDEDGVDPGSHFFFDHSFCLPEVVSEAVAWCDYGIRFTAATCRDNLWATQFHPEKSQRNGLKLLRNFLDFAEHSA